VCGTVTTSRQFWGEYYASSNTPHTQYQVVIT
jgi:hypothetical protein